MINGRLYDTESMNEIGHRDRPRNKFYWESDKYNPSFDWHLKGRGFFGGACGCAVMGN
jgi:hypothetical protein